MRVDSSNLIHLLRKTHWKNGICRHNHHQISKFNSQLHSQSYRKKYIPEYPLISLILFRQKTRGSSVQKGRYQPSTNSWKLKGTVSDNHKSNRTLPIRLGNFRISKVCQLTQKKEELRLEWQVQNMLNNLMKQLNLRTRLKIWERRSSCKGSKKFDRFPS